RAVDPGIINTEKPMEIAFINSILQSPTFPPQDPWFTGYSISYYYFGYVLVAMLTRITGAAPEVAFNLALALLFALTALGAYGLVYNLLQARRRDVEPRRGLGALPLLGPLFVLLVSNMEGLLESLHARGLFWKQTEAGLQSSFWSWLDIKDLIMPPAQPFSWIPNRATGGWIWWRASRVVSDYTLDGSYREVIDEFPFFSYLLGDLHPHVLVIPFALLAIGVILNFALDRRRPGFNLFGLWIPMDRLGFFLTVLVLGSLGFMNTWDFPIYVAIFAGVYTLIRAGEAGWRWSRLGDFVGLGLALGLGGILLYLPFYLGFASQARGLLPSLMFFTRGVHFWVMFAPLLLPVLVFLVFIIRRTPGRMDWKKGFLLSGGLVLAMWLASYLFSALITLLPAASGLFLGNQAGGLATDIRQLISAATFERLQAPGTWLTLGVVIALCVGLLVRQRGKSAAPDQNLVEEAQAVDFVIPSHQVLRIADTFAIVLILMGALITLFPEFFYLWDGFGVRMNTIFKFYYQAWILWGIAAAYTSAVLLAELRRAPGIVFRLGWLVVTLAALIYPVYTLWERTNGFKPVQSLSLDGLQVLQNTFGEDEINAIHWLREQPYGVVAEAAGGGYDYVGGNWITTGRFSRYTGLPAVMGWSNHEGQWGRDSSAIQQRLNDVETLYSTTGWEETRQILDRYQVRYVILGSSEMQLYRVNQAKFDKYLSPVYQSQSLTIYEVPGREVAVAAYPNPAQNVGENGLP
ncbi:MAG TPA: DUF2298 domain-containing protein, partial [Anaerolineaceae bacterium]|nr:DUF2298 domain-containing protein [Anaerolineaceae bacterium]